MKWVRDLAIETLIAIILVSAYVAYLFLRPIESRLDWRLIFQAVNTAMVFGFCDRIVPPCLEKFSVLGGSRDISPWTPCSLQVARWALPTLAAGILRFAECD
jgi:hypothetical protein